MTQQIRLTLVTPSLKYFDSFIEAVASDRAPGMSIFDSLEPEYLKTHKEEYLAQLKAESEGRNLQPGRVAHSMYWSIDANGKFIGLIDIRHELTESLRRDGGHIGYAIRKSEHGKGYGKEQLSLALEKAKALGLTELLLTCTAENLASQKVIERNGGVKEMTDLKNSQTGKLKYWITLT